MQTDDLVASLRPLVGHIVADIVTPTRDTLSPFARRALGRLVTAVCRLGTGRRAYRVFLILEPSWGRPGATGEPEFLHVDARHVQSVDVRRDATGRPVEVRIAFPGRETTLCLQPSPRHRQPPMPVEAAQFILGCGAGTGVFSSELASGLRIPVPAVRREIRAWLDRGWLVAQGHGRPYLVTNLALDHARQAIGVGTQEAIL